MGLFLAQGRNAWHHANPPWGPEEWERFAHEKIELELRMHLAAIYDQMPLQRHPLAEQVQP